MQLDGHLPVGLLDLLLIRLGSDSEDIIIRRLFRILIGTRSTARSHARSSFSRAAVLATTSCRALGFPRKDVLASSASDVKLSFVRMRPFEIKLC
jgi:hypothetical protein